MNTPLGDKLMKLRQEAIDKGMPLLTLDELIEKVYGENKDKQATIATLTAEVKRWKEHATETVRVSEALNKALLDWDLGRVPATEIGAWRYQLEMNAKRIKHDLEGGQG